MQTKALLVSNDLASMHIYTYNKYKPMYQYIDNERTVLHLIILYIPPFKFHNPAIFRPVH